MTARLTVVRPGLLTTVQDLGRWGLQSRGVPVAGPMDPVSHRVANALVGNDPRAALLEVTLIGPEVEFDDARIVAVAGAQFELSLDGRAVPHGTAFAARAGTRLRLGRRVRGSRAYVAVAGGIDVPEQLGSRATHMLSRMGGFEGRALAPGDRLPLGGFDPGRLQRSGRTRLKPPDLPAAPRVRVVPGPERDRFAEDALDVLQSAPYSIAPDSDRMGYRLEGPAIAHKSAVDIISNATAIGMLQVPASRQPVLLMADRQTTGGYPKIAAVITADLPVVGQLGPGDAIAFEVCSRRDALAALIAQERALMALEEAARA